MSRISFEVAALLSLSARLGRRSKLFQDYPHLSQKLILWTGNKTLQVLFKCFRKAEEIRVWARWIVEKWAFRLKTNRLNNGIYGFLIFQCKKKLKQREKAKVFIRLKPQQKNKFSFEKSAFCQLILSAGKSHPFKISWKAVLNLFIAQRALSCQICSFFLRNACLRVRKQTG